MASTAPPQDQQLVDRLKSLGLSDSVDKYPNCYPDVNTVDVYRAHLTSILREITGVDPAVIYPALAWTQTLEKGDLVLPVPALRVKGRKPQELAEEWAAKVIQTSVFYLNVC
jgi:arginyl-tRNA synthetase